ncbi:hypothetical protein ACFL1X_00515, partial [Candidatus Hydrogenedentota bacterium]
FMNMGFFKKLAYDEVAREGNKVIMLKAFEPVELPVLHKLDYQYEAVPGKVVVDAFWSSMCPTTIKEIINIREVCPEFGDAVLLNEYNCDDGHLLEKHQTARALFINGEQKDYGDSGTKEELREEIEKAKGD